MQSKPASSLRAVGTLHGMWSSSAGRCVSRSDAWMTSSARVSAIVSTYYHQEGLTARVYRLVSTYLLTKSKIICTFFNLRVYFYFTLRYAIRVLINKPKGGKYEN